MKSLTEYLTFQMLERMGLLNVTTQVADDGTVTFGTVVFDATLDMNVIPSNYFAYSYRGHRWVF